MQPTIATVLSYKKKDSHHTRALLAIDDQKIWVTVFGQPAYYINSSHAGAKIFVEDLELSIDGQYYNFVITKGQFIKDGKIDE